MTNAAKNAHSPPVRSQSSKELLSEIGKNSAMPRAAQMSTAVKGRRRSGLGVKVYIFPPKKRNLPRGQAVAAFRHDKKHLIYMIPQNVPTYNDLSLIS